MTRGGDGAFARSRTTRVELPAPPTAVADTVGAGDSFMSATLDALAARTLLGPAARAALPALDRPTLTAVLRHAVAAAAVTVSRPGATPPDTRELAAALVSGAAPA